MGAHLRLWLVGAILTAVVGCGQNHQDQQVEKFNTADVGIFGGQTVTEASLLSKALVQLKWRIGADELICSAARISKSYLITAAHCAGADQIEVFSAHGEKIGQITSRVIHPQYKVRALQIESSRQWNLANEFDVAVLQFRGDSLEQDEVPVFRFQNSMELTSKLTVAGFGFENYNVLTGQRSGDGRLQWTELEQKNSVQPDVLVFDQSQGRGICVGDSGGVVFQEKNQELNLIAIAVSVRNGNSSEICQGESRFLRIQWGMKFWIQHEIENNLKPVASF